MGKKLGENSKAVAARARKAAVKEEQTASKQKQTEDAYWKDDDKHILKKQQRKEEQDRKRQEQLKKKAENSALLEEEMSAIKKTTKPQPAPKVTRTQIEETLKTENKQKEKEKEKPKDIQTHLDIPLEENVNRLIVEGEEARSITDAISLLSSKEGKVDRHPEKRLKAAFTAYEERRIKEMKQENPTLKHSQLKQLIFKEWQKSPENPLNSS